MHVGQQRVRRTPGQEASAQLKAFAKLQAKEFIRGPRERSLIILNSTESWSKFLCAALTQVAEERQTPDNTLSSQVLCFTTPAKSFQRGHNNSYRLFRVLLRCVAEAECWVKRREGVLSNVPSSYTIHDFNHLPQFFKELHKPSVYRFCSMGY